ncbi:MULTISPECIES: GntR family transcriptional regulator [unclassified Streptomyces]|uniref:GntR family transcriptional regulator n=1 Tax=unclassified Streptomyces TaxID=2593676 RepID=UPI0022B6120D|nr:MULTISPECIES: GntR family transcriptional regulator [unclassified Streptomyces]MCZ7416094.1 GntR family transcriptional regulator [Streptomyces sp. WMMC897]MCZ7434098.1 GntR family transcriptional regulator [Streptomyces sp. WMMC1477]
MRISAHMVCTAVRDDIVSGALPPGSRLTEELLARRYGVSRVPVREALRTLESEGFVTTRRHAGACVAQPTEQEAADLLDMRALLEPLGAARAAHRRTGAHLKVLRGLVRLGRQRTERGQLSDLRALGDWFHETLAQASGSPALETLLVQLRRKITWMYAVEQENAPGAVERASAVWREHGAIVDALARRDAERARALAAAHVERAGAIRRAQRPVMVRTTKPAVNTARGPV